ncbi:HupE/UreJ family protein [Micromonospora foliorum]|uniref:HupE/UreJ family protein n=1 Tax=Micromonospora foliorum TaxID=2911210 RepID=UPI001EE803B8|nr:HupE/UreJ family protein [Micromonospora foliorum]MCG5436443.1 HupE/UreJ family protein [Micromonospora foliorum]
MSAAGRRTAAVSAMVVMTLLAAPGIAWAHGVGGSSETVGGFVWLGTKHMLAGWDHLLFVGGILLLAGEMRRAAKLISLFALGHSITLFTATVADWHINPVPVDIVVALSLVFVGVVGLRGRPKNWSWFAVAVLSFGLVHGLGLSTRLQDLGLPSDGLIPRVLAFNVGVEIGQLIAVVAMFMLGDVLRHYLPRLRDTRLSHGVLVAAGVIAAAVLAITSGGDALRPVQPTSEALGDCEVTDRDLSFPAGGGHPTKDFFEPTETVPATSFGHVIGDGYVIVTYRPDLPAEQVSQLRGFVTDPSGGKVVGGSAPEQKAAVKATHVYRTLTCTTVDPDALAEFTRDWFDDPRSTPPE